MRNLQILPLKEFIKVNISENGTFSIDLLENLGCLLLIKVTKQVNNVIF
jgi:hypothetical protein